MESRHSELQTAAPKCWTCHGTHDVSQPSSQALLPSLDTRLHVRHVPRPRRPTRCAWSSAGSTTRTDRRCDTCHHPDSQIYAQIEGIANAVVSAEEAYDDAEDEIEEAAGLGMITSDAEVALAGAKTSLIQAQAAVHTTKLTSIAELSADAGTKAEDAKALATAKVDESVFRREAMVVVLGFILLGVAWLWLLKRRLDRELERDLEARSHE